MVELEKGTGLALGSHMEGGGSLLFTKGYGMSLNPGVAVGGKLKLGKSLGARLVRVDHRVRPGVGGGNRKLTDVCSHIKDAGGLNSGLFEEMAYVQIRTAIGGFL
ncbi:MAG: hypothetical protein HC904_02540 [Blastochloris sp.]|nr:hypothetical protein [Blastochloris sp.]